MARYADLDRLENFFKCCEMEAREHGEIDKAWAFGYVWQILSKMPSCIEEVVEEYKENEDEQKSTGTIR